ncbi:MAG: carbon storage regulator [Planctomycetia bacterium]|nr:carbon storage regulator [Planctomycetia bacterium]
MLVLTRKMDDGVIINQNIRIYIVDIHGDKVRLGFELPEDASVLREEIFIRRQQEEVLAAMQ